MKSQKVKVKNKKCKVKVKSFAFCLVLLPFALFLFTLPSYALAKEITILYTGQTHAMLYNCGCPVEPDGGVARRATLIKQIKKTHPQALVLDSGGFFAGGALDEHSQNTQLDTQRALINLRSMELMGYDAAAIGEDEFNFGLEFLQDNIGKLKSAFLSCNIKVKGASAYAIKDIDGNRIGIIGVTAPSAAKKVTDLTVDEPVAAVRNAIERLKSNKVGLIIILSNLGEPEDVKLANNIEGIGILISSQGHGKSEPFSKIKKTLLLRPSWQGRKLGKVTFELKSGEVIGFKVENIRLSDKIADDKEILGILPACFSDVDCKKDNIPGTCKNPGAMNAVCEYEKLKKIDLTVITRKDCVACETEGLVDSLKKYFPGIAAEYLYYPEKKAVNLVNNIGILGLPAYILGREAEKEKNFSVLKNKMDEKNGYYILKPQASGVSYFLNREEIKGRFDIFISLFDKNAKGLLEVIKEFNPFIHFLTSYNDGDFSAKNGQLEVEEYKRSVCLQKYYPASFWGYIACRANNINTSWWDDCLVPEEVEKIRNCAKSNEADELLKENTKINKELGIMLGPTYLLDNKEIFSSEGVPTRDELKKIIKR